MTKESGIKPDKITKPMQLLGAWLVGLFSVDSCFIFAASQMDQGSLESISLVIAAILNVPLFLVAVFVLQTKFRPELQEDSYYSTYLSQKTNEPVTLRKSESHLIEISKRLEVIESSIENQIEDSKGEKFIFDDVTFGVNHHLKNKESLRKLLSDYRVHGVSSFGTDEPPNEEIVVISQYLPKSVAHEVIQVAKQVGIQYYNYFDNVIEDTDEDVLFGGYGDAKYQIA